MGNWDQVDRPDYSGSVVRWLEFGSRHFHLFSSNPSRLGRFGPPETGALGIEATALYAFIHGLTATDDSFDLADCPISADECVDHGLAAFRYCLHSHASAFEETMECVQWGGTGMSPKMADQLALAAEVLDGFLEDQDRERLVRLIRYEADCNTLLPYHLEHVDHGFYRRRPPVPTERFGTSYPESNAWRANVLARALLSDPDSINADKWRESMLMHLTNALSTPADAEDDTVVDGRPICEWHAGANLHPNYALEHHGFFHPGYVNRALLSLFSTVYAFEDAGVEPPEALLRNVPELWDVQRRLLLWDGSLAYPAGDDYPRYCWGLTYLLPVLVFMQQKYGDTVAARAEKKLADLLCREQQTNRDGSFNAGRLQAWGDAIETNRDFAPTRPAPSVYYRTHVDVPYYLALAHWWHQRAEPVQPASEEQMDLELAEPFCEPDCGLVFHRSPKRFASWSWNAHGSGVQGLVLPRDGDHMAEWEGNLISRSVVRGCNPNRRVVAHTEVAFDSGIAASGIAAACDGAIEQQMGFTALPDGQTSVCLSRARSTRPVELLQHEGMRLNIANDVFNGNTRMLTGADFDRELPGFGAANDEITIDSAWLNVDDMLGIIALDRHEFFTVLVDGERRATGQSLCYHRIVHPYLKSGRRVLAGELIEDSAIALVTDIGAEETPRWMAWHLGPAVSGSDARALTIRGSDDVWYVVAIGYGEADTQVRLPLTMQAAGSEMLVGEPEQFRLVGDGVVLSLPPAEMVVVALAVNAT